MAYVPGFTYDIFLSYASDNLEEKLGAFVADLRRLLRVELGGDFSGEHGIFFDKKELNLAPTAWKEKLRMSAASAAILVPILSPSYATSDFCAKELEWFQDNPPLNWPAGDQTVYRICPMSWYPIEPGLRDQVASDIRRAQEQREPSPDELARKLANGLRMMRRSRQTVFLGESEHETQGKVRDELSRMGFRVEPQAPSAYSDTATVRTLLGDAKLAVHFVGNQQSQRPLDAIRDSREYCQRATVVYEVPGVDLSDEERVSLEWLEADLNPAAFSSSTDAADRRTYDRISGAFKNLDQFLQVIRDRLEGARPASTTQIGIACEESDRASVTSIIPEIQSRTGFSVICHGLSLLDFKKSLGIVFYWGQSEGKRLRQARRILKPYDAFFLAPPPKPDEHKTELAGLTILYQQSDQFHVDDIRPFLARLGWKG
jgi:hypothetical protein